MAGLQYRRIALDVGAAFKKRPFKPNTHFNADPVPASNPQVMDANYKYRPGTTARDPVPARSASDTFEIPSFTTVDYSEDGSFAGPDPIPANSFWEDIF